MSTTVVRRVLWLLPVAAAAIVWFPITKSYFFADDYVWMLRFATERPGDVILAVFGGHVLVIRNLIYWASYTLFDLDPAPYAWTVLLTHLANVALLFRVAESLTRDARLATLAALAWGVSPLLVGTLNWYSVYGHVLVGTALLIVLDGLTRAEDAPSTGEVLAWGALLLAGVLCFGVAMGVAAAFPVVLLLLRPATRTRRGPLLAACALPVAVAGLYFGLRQLALRRGQLPLSEMFVLHHAFDDWRPVVEMLWRTVCVGVDGLVRGFWSPTWRPHGTGSLGLLLGVGATAVLVAALDSGPRRRRLLAASLLCAAAYGIVALGRANLYAAMNMSPIDAARQLRYQYVGTIGAALVLAVTLDGLKRWPGFNELPSVVLVVWIAAAAYGFSSTDWRIDQRDDLRREVLDAKRAIVTALAAAAPGADVRIDNIAPSRAMLGPGLQPTNFPGLAGLFALHYPDDVVQGHRVVFVERDPAVIASVQRGGPDARLARLLVAR